MEYNDIYNEYTSLLRNKAICLNRLTELKAGYISTKTISGKRYFYLQHRVEGKLLSEYIKEERLSAVEDELEKRSGMLARIKEIDSRLNKIEAAAAILDDGLRRKLITLRRCSLMEAMPFEERGKSLAFGIAMTALEGIPASAATESNLSRWANGEFSFRESYLNTLRTHHLAEV